MASIRQYPGCKNWYACFSVTPNQRIQRSTRETDPKKAQAIADKWEQIAREKMKADHVQKVIGEIYESVHKEALPSASFASFAAEWLASRKSEVARETYRAYSGVIATLSEWLQAQGLGKAPLREISQETLTRFRDAQSARVSAVTANKLLKQLRIIFAAAHERGIISGNPAKKVPRVKESSKGGRTRRAFTMEEIRSLLAVADAETRSMILFGLYTGQRLGDLATMTPEAIDTRAREIVITTSKTGKLVRIPIAAPLAKHIETLTLKPGEPIHPGFAPLTTGGRSNKFRDAMVAAGIQFTRHKGAQEGNRRTPSALSFHCLRHTATSLMKNSGVSSAIVQDIIGHESDAISAQYTHIDGDAKRRAIDLLPDVT